MKIKPIKIKTPKGMRLIGPGQPTFIVAELSGNHHLKYQNAIKLIDAAIGSGADAIKIQTYTPDTMTIDSDKKYFQIKVNKAWKNQTLYELYQKCYTPWHWQPKLKKYAEKKGILLFSTPFDATAVDFLEKMKVELYKIASFEVNDIPFLKKVGQTKKPVIMSNGMASSEDIRLAVKTLKQNGCPQLALLQCISSYPAKPEEMNLSTIPDTQKKFKVISGLSDHSLSNDVAVASVALGASIIEKHFIISRKQGGPDANFSVEPHEFKELVNSIRVAEKAIGKPSYVPGKKEKENLTFRRSLFVVKDIQAGQKFTSDNIRSIRPAHGLHPKYYEQIIGKVALKNIQRGTPLNWQMIKK